MKTCERCGVAFDATPYLPDAPCPDCQGYEPDGIWLKFDRLIPLVEQRRDDLIKRMYYKRASDREIGRALGMPWRTVGSVRRRLGIPGHQFSGDEKWGDPDAVRAAISERNRGKSNSQRAHKKGKPVQGSLEGYVGALRRKGGMVNVDY